MWYPVDQSSERFKPFFIHCISSAASTPRFDFSISLAFTHRCGMVLEAPLE